jgi:hypothetical protein
LYTDSIGPVSRLASEAEAPFLFQGRTVASDRVEREWGRSIRRFPTVRECLIENERAEEQPDLALMDWSQFRSTADADVCLFRIAASYRNMQVYQDWLEHHGFSNFAVFESTRTAYGGDILQHNASRSHENGGRLFWTGLLHRIIRADHASSVTTIFDLEDEVLNVHFGLSTK